jgi:long-chain-alcohol oxidase
MAATRERVVGALLDTFFPKLQPADRYVAEDQKHQLHVEYSSFQPTDVSGTVSKAGLSLKMVPMILWCSLLSLGYMCNGAFHIAFAHNNKNVLLTCLGCELQVMEAIDRNLNEDQRNQLYLVFFLLSTRWGTALLGGFQSCNPIFPTAFPDLPVASRDQILQSWSTSRFYLLRKAFTGLKSLLLSHTFTYMNSEASGTAVLRALQYPITDPKRPARPLPAAVEAERVIESSLIDLSACCDDRHKLAGTLGAKGLRVVSVNCDETVVKGCNIDPDIIEICQPECVVSCDAVVVGSGAGGGVVSARLAASGMRVIIVEKSTFVPSAAMSQQEGQGVAEMYEASGLLLSESGAMSILAGSTLGGGTRVNWSASFRTPDHVRREWSQKYELECFSTENEDFEQALDAVCNRLSVKTGFTHGGACKAFASGLESLNIHCGQVPRNCVELGECSGYCSFGCARGAKQDTVNTFLADAAKHGARIITGAFVESIIRLKSSSRTEDTDKRRVGGVLVLAGDATQRPARIVISSPIVVSCGGAINSPALFLRSGISCSGMIGSNLRLHPCTCVVGKFPLKASSLPNDINGTIR